MESGKLTVLLVEDNPGDVFLIKKAFVKNGMDIALHVVRDGVEATRFLWRQEPYVQVPRPNIIILDLNLPRKDGRELLAEIKTDKDLGPIPVIVFTTSTLEDDVKTSYALHANSYVVKVSNWEDFSAIVRSVKEYWLKISRIPGRYDS